MHLEIELVWGSARLVAAVSPVEPFEGELVTVSCARPTFSITTGQLFFYSVRPPLLQNLRGGSGSRPKFRDTISTGPDLQRNEASSDWYQKTFAVCDVAAGGYGACVVNASCFLLELEGGLGGFTAKVSEYALDAFKWDAQKVPD